jgi:hypothetical protein
MRGGPGTPATGRAETVPANMTYEQWHNKYVKGNKEAEEKEKELKRMKKK